MNPGGGKETGRKRGKVPVVVRTSTKSFLQITGSPGQLPNRIIFKRNCEHSYVKFPPPGWTSQEKEEGRGRRRGEGGRARSEGGE